MAKKKSSARRSSSSSRKRSRRKKPKKKQRSSQGGSQRGVLSFTRQHKSDLFGLIAAGVGSFTLLSMLSPQQGVVTRFWLGLLRGAFGWAAYLVPLLLLAGGIGSLLRRLRSKWEGPDSEQVLGSLMLFLALLVTLHALLTSGDAPARLAQGRAGEGGGVVGAALLSVCLSALGGGGAAVLLAAWVIMGLTLVSKTTVPELLALAGGGLRWVGRQGFEQVRSRWPRKPVDAAPARTEAAPEGFPQDQSRSGSPRPEPSEGDLPSLEPTPQPPTAWELPKLGAVLEPGVEGRVDKAFDQERARLIEETLLSFGAPSRVVEINRGPTITQFGLEPDYVEGRGGRRTKVKVSKISSLADDLALALAAPSIRVEAPVPGKGFVGVEVPNEEISLVSLRDVMESERFQGIDSNLRIGLGQDVSGAAICADLAAMPHLLIAGTTGSGKSVCVNALVTCLLLQNTPDELKFVMIDPKRVELTLFNGVPHLLAPVVVDLDRVVGALQWVSREMDERYGRFAKEGVRNIREYNQRVRRAGGQILPYLVVVIDELADLMMLAPDETERVVTRLAQLARATGIHLVIATQRPSVDVVTGLIKANFPARVAFAVASSVDSRVILDQPGAERLLGRGDMLFQSPDAANPVRMQGSFVSEPELARLIRFWKEQVTGGDATQADAAAEEEGTLTDVEFKQAALWEDLVPSDEEVDELFEEAVAVVREMRRASISLLQRRLRIGYTRAARIVDQMEERGIVGPEPGGSQAREVLDYGELPDLEGQSD